MKYPFRIKLAALLSMVCLLCFCACEKEMPKRLDGMYSSDGGEISASSQSSPQKDTQTTGDPAAADEVKISAPPFVSGNYTMSSSSAYEQYIYDGGGNILSQIKTSQTYDYQINLKVNASGSMTAVYTFARIRTSYEGLETVYMDTDDQSGLDGNTAAYYDLIGQSFTVKADKNYNLSLSGIDKIHRKYPDAASLVTEDNMREVAADLFYPLDGSLSVGSTWQLTQSGVKNTYRVSRVGEDKVYVAITGGELEIPAPFTSDGFTYTYTQCAPLSGSLVIDRSNRMIQEQSSYQENKGSLEYEGSTYGFTEAASSVCNITKQ